MKWNVSAALAVLAVTGGALYGGALFLPESTGLSLKEAHEAVATTLAAVALIVGRYALDRRRRHWSGN